MTIAAAQRNPEPAVKTPREAAEIRVPVKATIMRTGPARWRENQRGPHTLILPSRVGIISPYSCSREQVTIPVQNALRDMHSSAYAQPGERLVLNRPLLLRVNSS
jgi:hypothetical protein